MLDMREHFKVTLGGKCDMIEPIERYPVFFSGDFLVNIMPGYSWGCRSSLDGNCPRFVHHHHCLLLCQLCLGHCHPAHQAQEAGNQASCLHLCMLDIVLHHLMNEC